MIDRDLKFSEIVNDVADILKAFDDERPIHKNFQPGIGPFGEPQLVKEISARLNQRNGKYRAQTKRTPDLEINEVWGLEFKIVRPFGDNGKEAENWSVNLLHPYEGNVSLIGDAIKLMKINTPITHKCLFVIGYEHSTPVISLDPLFKSFEVIASDVVGINLGARIEERRGNLVHPEHQAVRCVGWEILGCN